MNNKLFMLLLASTLTFAVSPTFAESHAEAPSGEMSQEEMDELIESCRNAATEAEVAEEDMEEAVSNCVAENTMVGEEEVMDETTADEATAEEEMPAEEAEEEVPANNG